MAKSRNKRSVGKVVAIIIAVVLSLAAGGCAGAWGIGYALTGEANPLNWFKTTTTTTEKPAVPRTVAISNDGQPMTNGCTYNMPATGFAFLSARSFSSETTEYVADGEITLTAELSNEYINGKFEYTVDFKDPDAEWAQGKVATYYVGLEPIDDGRQVKVNYLAPFSEQIVLTAKLQGTESSDSCTIDCVRAATHGAFEYYGDIEDASNVFATISFGEGTIDGEFSNGAATVYIDEDFIETVNDYLTFDISVKPFSYAAEPDFTYSDYHNLHYLGIACERMLEFSDIINGFDDYDQDHKDAIYYAWYRGYGEYKKTSGSITNTRIDVSFEYCYAGCVVERFVDTDILGNYYIKGECLASTVQPSVTLNKNYVF